MALNIYYDKDADLGRLDGKTVAIIGYGSQGHAHAQNLHASGRQRRGRPAQGLRLPGRRPRPRGCASSTPRRGGARGRRRDADAARRGRGRRLRDGDRPGPRRPATTSPSPTASTSTSRPSQPPEDVNVFMVAPKGPGHTVRAHYEQGRGVPSLVAVHADPTGDTLADRARLRQGHRRGPRRHHRDDLPRGDRDRSLRRAGGAVRRAHVADDRPATRRSSRPATRPRWRTSRCIHEVKLIVDLIYEGGIANMRYSVSNTAEYGDLTRGPRVIDAGIKARMKEILGEIQRGEFAKEFILENRAGNVGRSRRCASRARSTRWRRSARELRKPDAVAQGEPAGRPLEELK